jgi:branched-chain amino acid transport system substrate-binding protein
VFKRVLKKSMGASLGLCLIASVAAGQAHAADPGVTKDKIVIGTTQPLTGPFAVYKPVSDASKAYFDYVNANGGINGRKIDFIVKDDQYANIPLTVTATNELINQDRVFAIFGALGTANRLAVAETLKTQRIPDVFINSGSSAFDNTRQYPNVFPYFPSYIVEAKVMSQYIKDTSELRNLKRCLLYQEGEFGDDAGRGFKAAGLDFAAQASFTLAQVSQRNLRSQVVTLAGAECELVVFFGVTPATALTLATAAGARFAPKWMVTSVGSEPAVLTQNLAAAGIPNPAAVLNGIYTPSFLVPIDDARNPYVRLMKGITDRAGLPWNFYTYYGVNTAYVMAQALKAAGPNPTRRSLVNALQTKSAGFRSAANVPMRITATSHQGLLGYWMGEYNAAGSLVRKTPGILIAGNTTTSGKVTKANFRPSKPTARLLP